MTIPPDLEAQILRYYYVEKWRVGTITRHSQPAACAPRHRGAGLGAGRPAQDWSASAACGHWGVESMHWLLDVESKDHLSRYRAGHGAANMAIVRRFAQGLQPFLPRTRDRAAPDSSAPCAASPPSGRGVCTPCLRQVGEARISLGRSMRASMRGEKPRRPQFMRI